MLINFKSRKFLVSFIIIILFFLSCRNPESFDNPLDASGINFADITQLYAIDPVDNAILNIINPTLKFNKYSNIEGYKVLISDNEDFKNPISIETTNNNITISSGLRPGKTYYWKVQFKYNGKYTNEYSRVFKFNINDIVLISPTNQSDVNTLKPTFQWTAIEGSDSFKLQISKNSSFSSLIIDKTVSGNSYTNSDKPFDTNITYYWRINTGDNTNDITETFSFTTPKLNLIEPINNGNLSYKNSKFIWSDLTGDNGYIIEISDSSDFTNIVIGKDKVISNSELTITDYQFEIDKEYYWRVRLKDGDINNWSDIYNFKAVIPVPDLISPIGDISDITPKFVWQSDITNPIFNLQISKKSDFTDNEVSDDTIIALSYDLLSDLVNLSNYYWRMRVKEGNLWSTWSEIKMFYPKINLGNMILDTPVNNLISDNTIVTFNWEKNTNADRYIFRLLNENGEMIANYSGSELNYTPPLLNVGIYYWDVSFYNAQNIYGGVSETRKIIVDIGTVNLLTPLDENKLPSDLKPFFSWSSNYKAVKYNLQISKSSDFIINDISDDTNIDTNWSSSTPFNNENYYWRVRVIDSNNIYGKWSDIYKINFYDLPKNVSVSKVTEENQVKINWDIISYPKNVEKYNIYRSIEEFGGYINIGETISTINSFYDTTSLLGSKYYYKMNIQFDDGTIGDFSDYDSGYWGYRAPYNLTVSDNIGYNIDLSWDSIGAADKYYIYRSLNSDGVYEEIGNTTILKYTDYNATENILYYYKIKSYSTSLGFSDFSQNVSKLIKKFNKFTKTLGTNNESFTDRQGHQTIDFNNKMWIIGGGNNYQNDVRYSSDGINWICATPKAPWSVRCDHTSVVFDNKIWVIGGHNGDCLNDVWYSSDGINWTQATSNAPWGKRSGHTSVVFDNKIWVIGGESDDYDYKNDVWYSSDGISWTPATSNAPWDGKSGHTSVVFDNKIWLFGGSFEIYKYKNDVWYSSDGINWIEATSNAEWSPRGGHTSIVFDNKIWIIGGAIKQYEYINDVWYSSDGNNWICATSNAPWSPRSDHSSVVFDNKMWVICGNYKNDIWYSNNGKDWASVIINTFWSGRSGHTSVVLDNKIWIIGGDGYKYFNDVWYSNDSINWTCTTTNASWIKRYNHTSIIFDNKIWVTGGQSYFDFDDKIFNDVWYSSDGINWKEATLNAPWSSRSGHTSIVFDNKIWIIGGYDGNNKKNDVWYSNDGINWTCATSGALWSGRYEHTSIVFNNKIWVIGGYGDGYRNDVWYSSDGVNWTEATSNAEWIARTKHSSVIYDNKIWVIGGTSGSTYKNDIWYSSDGINWIEAISNADWSARYSHTSVVFDNKIWIIGGYFSGYQNDVWYSEY